ncbi:MAG: hypothetical protein BWY40_00826 [bacterium ADurb.Bin270]|nr:MAG: hypothetical protein BWY40_00826 [bacterium ADurb.Bin270]
MRIYLISAVITILFVVGFLLIASASTAATSRRTTFRGILEFTDQICHRSNYEQTQNDFFHDFLLNQAYPKGLAELIYRKSHHIGKRGKPHDLKDCPFR